MPTAPARLHVLLARDAPVGVVIRRGPSRSRPRWTWADLDGDRLVWAATDILYAGRVTPAGLADDRPLFDSNPMTFERIVAPY